MNKTKRSFRPFHILYLIAMLCIIILIMRISFTKSGNYVDKTAKHYAEIDSEIRLDPQSTEVLNLRKLSKYFDKDTKTFNLYYRIPELTRDTTLIYRSKDVYTTVYADDTKIYETNVPQSPLYNASPGNLWNEVIIDKSYSGKMLTIKVDIVYDTNAVTVDNLFLGDGTNILIHFVHEKLFSIFVSILMILIGIIFIMVNMISHNRAVYLGNGLLYLGIYSLLIGIWCLLETNVIQFFASDQRILQLCNNIIMATAMLPLFLYLDYTYDVLKHPITCAFCGADLIYMYVCIIAQFTDLSDMHNLLFGSHIALVFGAFLFLCWMIYECILCKREKRDMLPVFLHMGGILALMISMMIEYGRFMNGDFADRAGLLRIGSLLFVIFFGASTQIQTNKLITKGTKYNVVKTLAYKDGLTSLGNRTAYLEKIDSYVGSEVQKLGIVYLDVNNLKKVNDNQGHEAGDELIQKAAYIIENSFGINGHVYRVGGDEFCVFLDDVALENTYHQSKILFEQLLEKANHDPKKAFDIRIAHGFAICREMDKDKIQDAIAAADQAMYDNKAALKNQDT